MSNNDEYTFRRDRDWEFFADKPCRASNFRPIAATVEKGNLVILDRSTPYASVELECAECEDRRAVGYITNKTDFAMLWAAFRGHFDIPGVRYGMSSRYSEWPVDHEIPTEVWIVWTKKRYKAWTGFLGRLLPRLVVVQCPKGAYDYFIEAYAGEISRSEIYEKKDDWKPLFSYTPEVMDEEFPSIS